MKKIHMKQLVTGIFFIVLTTTSAISSEVFAGSLCLPMGTQGRATSVGFTGGNHGRRGSFVGIRFIKNRASAHRVLIRDYRSGIGRTYYDGPPTVGLFISLPHSSNYHWTAWGSKNHDNAICVDDVYR